MKQIFTVGVKNLALFSVLSLGLAFRSQAQQLSISGGNDFSMVVCRDGRIMTWGNTFTATGDVLTANVPTPVNAPAGLKFSQADAGSGYHVLALDCENKVWAFGGNSQDQLGFKGPNSGVPKQVPGLNGQAQLSNVIYVSGGNTSSYAILENGEIVSWGDNRKQQLGRTTGTNETDPLPNYVLTAPGARLTNIIQVDAGDETAYALDINGNVYSWGDNQDNALGRPFNNGFGGGVDTYAKLVLKADGTPLTGIVSISAGDRHCLALAEDNTVWSWGGDWGGGQLGQGAGNQTNRQYASQVVGINGVGVLGNATYIAAGQASSMVVVKESKNSEVTRLVTFGANCLYAFDNPEGPGGNLGHNSTECDANTEVPQYVVDCATQQPLLGITEVSDGDAVTFAITKDRQVYVMGANKLGTLGTGDNESVGCATKLNLMLYSCGVPEPCPTPSLGPDLPICSENDLGNIRLSVQDYPSYTYKWFYRPGSNGTFTEVTITDTNFFKPTKIGQYYVEVTSTQSSCTQCEIGRDTINIGQGINNTFCTLVNNSLTFSAPAPQQGIYRWWKSLSGTADSLAPRGITKTVNINDLTPEVNEADSTYSLYLEDLRVYNGSVGVANAASVTGTSYPRELNQDRNAVYFDVHKKMTLQAVSLRFYNYGNTGNYDVTLTVFNAATNQQVFTRLAGLDIPSASGAPGAPVRFVLNQSFDPGSYYIRMTAVENNNVKMAFYDNSPQLAYPALSTGPLAGFLTLRGIVTRDDDPGANVANSSPAIFNWEISGQNTCRLKISWTRDCPCTKPALDLKTITGPTSFCSGVASPLTLTPNATPNPPVNPATYLYQWYKNGAIIQGQNAANLTINPPAGIGNYLVRVGHTSLQRTKCFAEDTLRIGIQPPISNNNLLTGNDTICLGSDAQLIVGSSNVTGGLGAPKYVWISSPTANGPYTTLPNDTLISYSPGKLQSSTYFRRVVTTGGVCKNDTSSAVFVLVDITPDKGTISTTRTTVCAGQSAVITASPDASGGKFTYQWQLSLDSISWSDIQGATQATYAPTPITQKTYYRRKVTSIKCFAFTDALAFKVDQPVSSASNTIAQDQIICKGNVPAALTGTTVITSTDGATIGTPTFLWLSSTTGLNGPWMPAVGTNNAPNYSPPALDDTTYYARAVSYGACNFDTTVKKVTIAIEPALLPGSIALTLPTICKGTSPIINSTGAATGGTLPYTYKWQYLENGTWLDIPNSDTEGPLTNAPADTVGRQYRRVVTSNAKCVQTTQAVALKVTGQMQPGSIQVTDTSVCAGGLPGLIKSTGEAAGGTMTGTTTPTYQWQVSLNGLAWTDITGQTGLEYLPGALAQDTYFRRRATNGPGSCDTVFAGPVVIRQYKQLDPGTITADTDSICIGMDATIESQVLPTQGSPEKTYTWIMAKAPFTTWETVTGNGPSLTMNFPTVGGFLFKRIVTDKCGTDTSRQEHLVLVAPKDTPTVNIITDLSPTFCDDKPITVRVTVAKAGNRKISWIYNNVTYFPTPDSIFVIQKPIDGANVIARVETDKNLFCSLPVVSSTAVQLKVNKLITNNTLLDTQLGICFGGTFNEVRGSTPSGGLNPIVYVWESAPTANGPWQKIDGQSGVSYKPTNITTTTYIRRIITSSGVCKFDTSNIAELFVDKTVEPGKIAPLTAFQCNNDSIRYVEVSSTAPATGGTNGIVYSWEYSINPTQGWTSLPNSSDSLKVRLLSLDPTELKTKFFFRRTARSAGGLCFAQADTIHVDVCQKPKVSSLFPNVACENEVITGPVILPTDFSPNGKPLFVDPTAPITKKVDGASVTVDASGIYTYTPAPGFIGRDTVTFTVCDQFLCVKKNLYVIYLPFNDGLEVNSERISNYRNQIINAEPSILENDRDLDGTDTLFVFPSEYDYIVKDSIIKPYKYYVDSIVAKPKNGTIRMQSDGTFSYEPNKDFIGQDTAVFWVCEHSKIQYCNGLFCKLDTIAFDIKPYKIFVPDGFSPNGDNVNDNFVIRSEVVLPMHIAVYNRWGNLVYENKEYKNDWNGTANRGVVIGSGLPDGTYYLYFNVNDKEAEGFKYITLTR